MSRQNYGMTKNRALLIILLALSITVSVQAQTTAAKPAAQAVEAQAAGAENNSAQNLAQAVATYKGDLTNLAASYEAGLKKLTDRNAELKQMLAQGYVSRLEVEQSDKAVA